MASYLQGSWRAPAAFTVRVTHHGLGVTSDHSTSAGDVYDSVDDALDAWNAELEADLGAGRVVLALGGSADAYAQSVSVTTNTGTFSVDWSHAGDGDAFRDWLGEVANLTTRPSGYTFAGPHLAGYALKYRLRAARRTGTTRLRGQGQSLDGTTQTQHTAGVGQADAVPVALSALIDNGTGDYEGHERLEAFIDEIFTIAGAMGGRFSVWHGEDGAEEQWVCRLDEEELVVMPIPVEDGGGSTLYEFDIPVIGVDLPW